MNKDFLSMVTSVGLEIQDTSSSFQTLLKTFINRRYFQILRAINWQNIRYDYSFNTVASQQDYVLPDDFGKEISVRDNTNGNELVRQDFADLVRYYPGDIDTEGSVSRYVIFDDTVQAQPATASQLTIVSSSSADTTQKVLIRGIVSGYETSEQVTLVGVTPQTSALTYSRVKAISKDGVTAGKVTITASTTTISVLAPKVLESRYKLCKLHYVPTTALSIAMPYIIKPLPLIENNDYPVLDIADLIEIGALADAQRYKRQFAKAQTYEVSFQTQLQSYIFDKENQPNEVVQFKPEVFDKDSLY